MKRSTLIAAAVFVVLFIGAIAVLRDEAERGITRLELSDFSRDAVDRVVFSGKKPAELEKDGAVLGLATGRQADDGGVTRLLDSLESIQSSDLLTEDESQYAEYQVDKEQGTRVEAYGKKKELLDLWIGKSLPGGIAVRSGSRVFKVTGVSQSALVRDPNAWIKRNLFDEKLEDASRLEVKLAGQTPYALKKVDDGWQVEDPAILPKGFRYDANLGRSQVSSLVNLRAKDFEEKDPGKEVTGLDESADRLSVTFTPSKQNDADNTEKKVEENAAPIVRTLLLGKEKGDSKDVYAKVEGRDDLFTLNKFTADRLERSVTDLRDLRLMQFDVKDVAKLALSDGKVMTLAFVKKDGVWAIEHSSSKVPEGFEFDPNTVEQRVNAIANARAMRLATEKDHPKSGFAGPVARATIVLKDGSTATLRFGKEFKDEKRDMVFARGNADDEVYVVTTWTKKSITGDLATFKKRAAPAGGLQALNPEALKNLPPEVREGVLKQLAQKQQQQQMMKKVEAQPKKAMGTKAP